MPARPAPDGNDRAVRCCGGASDGDRGRPDRRGAGEVHGARATGEEHGALRRGAVQGWWMDSTEMNNSSSDELMGESHFVVLNIYLYIIYILYIDIYSSTIHLYLPLYISIVYIIIV